MAVERKCLKCQTWNKDNDFCINCGAPISPVSIEKKREQEREKLKKPIVPSKFTKFLEIWKNSRFLPLRWLYYIFYSIAFVFFSIASFFVYLSVAGNG